MYAYATLSSAFSSPMDQMRTGRRKADAATTAMRPPPSPLTLLMVPDSELVMPLPAFRAGKDVAAAAIAASCRSSCSSFADTLRGSRKGCGRGPCRLSMDKPLMEAVAYSDARAGRCCAGTCAA